MAQSPINSYSGMPLGKDRERAWLRLGPFACLRLYIQGRRDGGRGVALIGEGWNCSSPFVEREHQREEQLRAALLLRLEEITAKASIAREAAKQRHAYLREKLEQIEQELARKRQEINDAMLTRRGIGEHALAEEVVRTRRMREFERGLASQERSIDAIKDEMQQLSTQVIALSAQIDQAEKRAQKVLDRCSRRTALRISVYNQALFNHMAHRQAIGGRMGSKLPTRTPGEWGAQTSTGAWANGGGIGASRTGTGNTAYQSKMAGGAL